MTETALIGGLVCTHGRIAKELVAAAKVIVQDVSHIYAVSIGWNDDVDAAKAVIEKAIQNVDQGKGVVILTDMFGGTPSNLTMSLLKTNELEIVTGVNLPMVIKLASQSGKESLSELVARIKEQGQKHISIASELLGE